MKFSQMEKAGRATLNTEWTADSQDDWIPRSKPLLLSDEYFDAAAVIDAFYELEGRDANALRRIKS